MSLLVAGLPLAAAAEHVVPAEGAAQHLPVTAATAAVAAGVLSGRHPPHGTVHAHEVQALPGE